MRTVTFGCANSLDNFIARPDGSVDWLLWSPEVAALTADFWKTIDSVVMGRKTYEAAAAAGMPAYPGVRSYVISRSMSRAPDPAVELVSGDGADFVRGLKAQEGRGICIMGGGVLARSLFEADLIDEVGVNVHPLLLGAGVPLFHPIGKEIPLQLRESRALSNGCVYLLYRVVRPAA